MKYWRQKDASAILQTIPQGRRLHVVCGYQVMDMDTFQFVPAVVLEDIDSKSCTYVIPRAYFEDNFEEVGDEDV